MNNIKLPHPKHDLKIMLSILIACLILLVAIIFTISINKESFQSQETLIDTTQVDTIAIDSIAIDTSFMTCPPQEALLEALIYYGVKYPEIVYAQAILETGHFTSTHCIKNNNLFGLYDSKNKCYFKFNHWTDSIKAYINTIEYRYQDGEDYYDFLARINYASHPNYINKLKQIVNL